MPSALFSKSVDFRNEHKSKLSKHTAHHWLNKNLQGLFNLFKERLWRNFMRTNPKSSAIEMKEISQLSIQRKAKSVIIKFANSQMFPYIGKMWAWMQWTGFIACYHFLSPLQCKEKCFFSCRYQFHEISHPCYVGPILECVSSFTPISRDLFQLLISLSICFWSYSVKARVNTRLGQYRRAETRKWSMTPQILRT